MGRGNVGKRRGKRESGDKKWREGKVNLQRSPTETKKAIARLQL